MKKFKISNEAAAKILSSLILLSVFLCGLVFGILLHIVKVYNEKPAEEITTVQAEETTVIENSQATNVSV